MFEERKERVLHILDKAIAENEVDEEIRETLDILNARSEYYTTSSCAGRIAVIWVPNLGGKKRSVFLGKWHREVTYNEVKEHLAMRDTGVTFLLSQSPIVHVASRDLESAVKLKNLALSCGFKNAGIKSVSTKIIVEIRSTERIDVPLGEKKLLVDEQYLRFLIKYANKALSRSRKKLKKLNKTLRESL
jgi:tRNA wybutosine-synthesizing protein 3